MSEPTKTLIETSIEPPTETIDIPLAQQTTEKKESPYGESPPQLSAGQWVSHYFVRQMLGKGGMGEVYAADDKSLKRKVALKILPKSLAADQEMQARFLQEARTLAALHHPNIGGIHDLTETPQGCVLVLEFIEGQGLDEYLNKRDALTAEEALPLFLQFAEALKAAHRRGITHRDLKPANLKLTPAGQLKVLDFGIATMREKQQAQLNQSWVAGSDTPTQPEKLFTDRGKVIGTPHYMAPEQLRGTEQDQRTDVWGFGCVLFEALTKRRPFAGNNYFELAATIFNEEPDWQKLPATTHAWVRELLHRCFEKAPDRRWQTMDEVVSQLSAAQPGPLRTRIIRVAPVTGRQSKTPAWLLPGLAALTVILATLLIGERGQRWWSVPAQKYLAIMPFKPLGQAAADPMLANGLLRLLRDNLNSVSGLQVIRESPPSDHSDNNLWLTKNLGATLILRGSVARASDRLNINYLLLNDRARTLKDETVENTDLLAAIDQVSAQVAHTLGLEFAVPPRQSAAAIFQLAYVKALGHLEIAQMLGGEKGAAEAGEAITLLGQIIEQPAGKQAIFYAAQARAYLIKYDLLQDGFWLTQAKNASEMAQNLSAQNEGQNDPQKRQVQFTLGEINQALERHQEAAQNFRQVLQQHPTSIAAFVGLANSYAALAQGSNAEQTFQKAIALDPGFWVSRNEYGNYAFEHGQYDEAARQWKEVVRLTPDNADGQSNLGIAYLYQGNWEAALAAFRQSLSMLRTPEAHANLGTALYYQGQFQKAAVEFKKGLELSPLNPVLLGNAGDAARQLSDQTAETAAYELALQQYQSLAGNSALSAAETAKWAELLAKRGRFAPALAKIDEALQQEPNHTECLASAITVYELAGQRAQALQWMRKALAQGYQKHFLLRDPVLAALRTDPQFNVIMRGN